MSLNIKNPEAYALASELAKLTGESLTGAVIVALKDRLRSEKQQRSEGRNVKRLLLMAEEFAKGMQPGSRSEDHATMLYGEDGLPK
jgi:antitoxin VapB